MIREFDFWKNSIMPVNSIIRDVILNLNNYGIKIVLITNEKFEIIGTISDGDIRRGLLKGLGLDSAIETIVNKNSIYVPESVDRETVKSLMIANKIFQIPIVNNNKEIIGLHLWDEISSKNFRPNYFIIMAGGKGKRLLPYTENCPKPLLQVSGKPILEHIIERAKSEGFNNFLISIHYLGNMIEEYFGNGEKFGVKIDYIREDVPLGTAGALSLINYSIETPIIITNGDVISDIKYGEILDFHNKHQSFATMAVKLHEIQNQFGVVQTDGLDIIGFIEKPIIRNYINAGVYVLSADSLCELEKNSYCDMPSLFEKLKVNQKKIIAYPMHESWTDIGRPVDFENLKI